MKKWAGYNVKAGPQIIYDLTTVKNIYMDLRIVKLAVGLYCNVM